MFLSCLQLLEPKVGLAWSSRGLGFRVYRLRVPFQPADWQEAVYPSSAALPVMLSPQPPLFRTFLYNIPQSGVFNVSGVGV